MGTSTGAGKAHFARRVHHAGCRGIHAFVPINWAVIPKDLLESSFVGYTRGAFGGARPAGKPGNFEPAYQGTIFLDEIGDLPLEWTGKSLSRRTCSS
jgi:transcriptional regulator with PAS, ATPase and Fis domain